MNTILYELGMSIHNEQNRHVYDELIIHTKEVHEQLCTWQGIHVYKGKRKLRGTKLYVYGVVLRDTTNFLGTQSNILKRWHKY